MQNHHRRGLLWGSICLCILSGFLEICKNKKNIFYYFFFLKKVSKIKKVFLENLYPLKFLLKISSPCLNQPKPRTTAYRVISYASGNTQDCWEAYTDYREAYTDCWEAYTDWWEAYTDCWEAYTDWWEAYTDWWEAYGSVGKRTRTVGKRGEGDTEAWGG
jgi:hypothetical protein